MPSPYDNHIPFQTILKWYKKHGRHGLPWRQIYHLPCKDRLYQVWIAEVMLQQTQVDRVVGYYDRFLLKYPTIESLAHTTYEKLFPYWQGLGYYSRARRMIELAKIIVEKYNGIFPEDFETLQKLPGIGKYTAQALLAFGYNHTILAVDANLEKIFSRYYLGSRYKAKSKKQEEGRDAFDILTSRLQKQVKKENISGRDINNALMDFGALTSTNYELIDHARYPLSECIWFQTGGKIEQEKREIKTKKPIMPPGERGAGGILKKGYKLMVFLHENHSKYWSSSAGHYEPFLIEPSGKDDRKSVQDYFSATYDLEVSVRPSFGSGILIPGLRLPNPVVLSVKLFHAQIQTGNWTFPAFPKSEKNEWVQTFCTIS